MSDTEAQLWELLHQAEHLPYGSGQIALVEQVITNADALRQTPLAFAARMQGTEAYFYGGEAVRALPTFAWCRAEFDRDPAAYAEAAIHQALAVLPDGVDRAPYDQLLEAARAAQQNDRPEETS